MGALLSKIYESTASLEEVSSFVSICSIIEGQVKIILCNVTKYPACFINENSGYSKFEREGLGICKFTYAGDASEDSPYLRINPEIIWVYSNIESSNDVFSNITWNVD